MSDQYARTRALLGDEAFQRLRSAHVAVFGVGGVGGYAAEALVRSGVGTLTVFDRDDVSLTNLNRQIIALHSTIGQDKTAVLTQRLHDVDPQAVVHQRRMFYLPENADEIDLTQFDFVVDAVDTVAAKVELAMRCEQLRVPLIAAMGAGNKLDPSQLRIADLYKTSVCPLARAMRALCRKRGVRRLTVAYSTEEPQRPASPLGDDPDRRKDTPASAMFVPAAMGLLIASHVVRQLAQKEQRSD